MKNLNKNQWVAVSVSLALLAYLLFSGPIMNFFNFSTPYAEDSQTPVSKTGLMVTEELVGNGALVESGDVLTVHYVGALEDGQVFDSSVERGAPFTFTVGVGQVIRGWDEGLVGMRVGGMRLLEIAPEYGYGGQEVGTIPPNSTLIFKVELLNAEKPASR